MNKKYLFVVGILVVIALIGLLSLRGIKHSNQVSSASTTPPKPLPKEVTVTLDKNGFTPNSITIKVGSAVRWINKSGSQETVNSDNYPTNQLHKELNFGLFANNSSVSHTFTKAGSYGYHNQLNPKQRGTITVD